MAEELRNLHGIWASFEGMVFEMPNAKMGDLAWRMRYTRPVDPKDAMHCASIIEAYMQLVAVDPQTVRNGKIKRIRQAMKLKPHVFESTPQSDASAEVGK